MFPRWLLTANGKACGAERPQDQRASRYFDLSLLFDYWATGRLYHHTAPIMVRHMKPEHHFRGRARSTGQTASEPGPGLSRRITAMGLAPMPAQGHRLNAYFSPHSADVNDVRVRQALATNLTSRPAVWASRRQDPAHRPDGPSLPEQRPAGATLWRKGWWEASGGKRGRVAGREPAHGPNHRLVLTEPDFKKTQGGRARIGVPAHLASDLRSTGRSTAPVLPW
jgi:hypothetical protein